MILPLNFMGFVCDILTCEVLWNRFIIIPNIWFICNDTQLPLVDCPTEIIYPFAILFSRVYKNVFLFLVQLSYSTLLLFLHTKKKILSFFTRMRSLVLLKFFIISIMRLARIYTNSNIAFTLKG